MRLHLRAFNGFYCIQNFPRPPSGIDKDNKPPQESLRSVQEVLIATKRSTAIKAVGLWLNLMTGDAHECHQDIESVDQ